MTSTRLFCLKQRWNTMKFKTFNTSVVWNLFIYILFVILLHTSCNKSSTLGSDLISDEWIKASGVDSFDLSMSGYSEDSLIYASAGFPSTFYTGKLSDPFFGRYSSEIYSQLYFAITNDLTFLHSKIDSVVLSIKYDTAAFLGNPREIQNIHIYPLSEALDLSKNYYNDVKINYSKTDELGSLTNYLPNLQDSVKFKIKDIEYAYSPQLRIPIDSGKFMGLLRSFPDSAFISLNYFNDAFKGIAIVSDATNSMLAFALANLDTKFNIYYNVDDTTKSIFSINLGLSRVSTNQIDNQGSLVEHFIKDTDPTLRDSLGFVQGFGGTDLRIKIPYNDVWSTKLVNHAILELISPNLVGDDPTQYKRISLMTIKELSTGKPISIVDAAFASSFVSTSDYIRYFGGNPVQTSINGELVYKYRFNITGYFTQMKKQKSGLDMVLAPVSKVQNGSRLIVGGHKNTKYPAKLVLVFSE